MSLTAFIGRCPHCGHDHGENTLFDVARGALTPSQQAKVSEQFANYAKQKPHLYGGCDEITTLREQVEKLTKERDDLRSRRCEVCGYLEHEREHTGCLREQVERLTEAYDQCGRTVQDYGRTIDQTESRLREVATHCANVEQQLAALAEQNERQSKALNTLLDISQVSHVSANTLESVCRSALSIPDLATPVLNKYRAEGVREAEKIVRKRVQWVSNGQGIQYRSTAPESISAESLADEIRARADELEKTND